MNNQQSIAPSAIPGCFRPVVKYSTAATLSLSKLLPKTPNPISIMDIVQHPLQESLFICATTDHRLCHIDFNRGAVVSTYVAHEDRINEICFTTINEDKDLGNVFFSASEDTFIKIWDSRTSSMVSSTGIFSCIVSTNSSRKSITLRCMQR